MKKEKLLILVEHAFGEAMCVQEGKVDLRDLNQACEQIMALIENMDLPEFLQGVALKQCEVDSLKKHIKNVEERCAELIDKKPKEVTEEWYKEKAIILTTRMPLWVSGEKRREWARNFIRSLVEDLGIIKEE